MKVGDLVKPLIACGGQLGGVRCEYALVLRVQQTYKDVEVDMFVYKEVEDYECELLCLHGRFDEEGEHLEVISEGR